MSEILSSQAELLCLFVQSMLLAESAVFLDLHTIRMIFLILGRKIITLLALRARKCDLGTHAVHLRITFRCFWVKKKETRPILTRGYYIIGVPVCQIVLLYLCVYII